MNQHDKELVAELELMLLAMLIADQSLFESLGVTSDDFSYVPYRNIARDLQQMPSSAPPSLKRWLKTKEVVAGTEGIKAALVERLRRFGELRKLESENKLAAAVARYIELSQGREG